MCVKVSQANISQVMQDVQNQLESLKEKINDDVSNEAASDLIARLHKSINQMTREINQSNSLVPFSTENVSSLTRLMHDIQRTPAFSQALGPQQIELMNLFKRLQSNIDHAQKKVQV